MNKSSTLVLRSHARFGIFAIMIILVALLLSACSADSQQPEVNIVEKSNSVLYLEVYDAENDLIKTASGFVIEDGRVLVTNYHVVTGAYRIVANTSDGESSVEVSSILAYDKSADLAILRCSASLGVDALVLGNSDNVQQGAEVYAIGYPLGLANTVSNGIVSSRYLDEDETDILQITAAISSGSSGGALLNSEGEVIGVTSASYSDGQNLNIAVSANEVKELLLETDTPIPLASFYKSTDPYIQLEEYLVECGEKNDYLETEEIYYAFDSDDDFTFEILYVKQSTIQEPGLHISFYDNRNQTLDLKQGVLAGKWNICEIYIVPEQHICQVKVDMCRAGLFNVYGSNTYASAVSEFIPISDVNSNFPLSYNSIDGKVSDAELRELYNQMVEVTLTRFDEWLQSNDIGCQIQDFKIGI